MDTDEPPRVLTPCLLPKKLIEELSGPGLFGNRRDIIDLLVKGTGWISWQNLNEILKRARDEFGMAERKFLDDLILYLTYKLREAERIRNERKQLNLF